MDWTTIAKMTIIISIYIGILTLINKLIRKTAKNKIDIDRYKKTESFKSLKNDLFTPIGFISFFILTPFDFENIRFMDWLLIVLKFISLILSLGLFYLTMKNLKIDITNNLK